MRHRLSRDGLILSPSKEKSTTQGAEEWLPSLQPPMDTSDATITSMATVVAAARGRDNVTPTRTGLDGFDE